MGIWAAILSVAALVGVLSFRNGRAALALSGALLLGSIVFVDGGRRDFFANHGWIPYAWLALALAPGFRFTFRSTLDNSVSSATLENFVQVAIYALVAALILRTRRLLVIQDPGRLRKGPVLLWPVIALASTAWSLVPLFTFIRALQLLVPLGLAMLMARLWLNSPATGMMLWRNTLRLFVRAVTILILLGFATGFWREVRFTWPGTHSGLAALYIGLGLIVLIAGGRGFLGLRMSGYLGRIALFTTTLYLGTTRGVIGGVALAIAVLLWYSARTKPLKGYLGISYYVLAVALTFVAARPEIMEYVARGESAETIASLNGRIPLWWSSIDLLSESSRWLVGFGYGSARVLLPTLVEWAGTAHSSWVELLLAIGIFGPLLALADVLYVVRYASSRAAIVPPTMTLSILALLVVSSITGETLAFPGVGYVTLALIHAPIITLRSSLDRLHDAAKIGVPSSQTFEPQDLRAAATTPHRSPPSS